jgi:hypothetical protein
VPGRLRARRRQWRLGHRTQCRHPAARAGQPHLLCDSQQEDPRYGREGVPHRLSRHRQLAHQEPRPACADNPQGGGGNREAAGRLPRPRCHASQADDSEDSGRCHRNARVDGQPGHLEQVHVDAARPVRNEVLLHHRARSSTGEADHSAETVRHRIRQFIDAEPAGGDPLGRHHRRNAAKGAGHRGRAPDGRQVPRGHEHPVLGHPPPPEAGARPVR